MDTPHDAEAISVRFCSSLTPLFLMKRRHEPWHARIEFSRATYNVYVTKFGKVGQTSYPQSGNL